MLFRRTLSLAVIAGALISAGQPAEARPYGITTGDFVVTTYRAAVKSGTQVLATVNSGTQLTVLDTQDRWARVAVVRDGREIKGWVNFRYLRRRPDCGASRLTFDNQSGENVLVRLAGPSRSEVYVPNGSTRTIHNVSAGHYRLFSRYNGTYGPRYVEGDAFDVTATSRSYSEITITLHGVIGGNYSSWPTTAAEFEAAASR